MTEVLDLEVDANRHDPELFEAAAKTRFNAYAPYSNYKVGAAVRDENGNIWIGCNVENAAYTGTHAEEAAICAMIANGGKRVTAIACVTENGGACCGGCRQRIWEFVHGYKDVQIFMFDKDGMGMSATIGELLPLAFDLSHLHN